MQNCLESEHFPLYWDMVSDYFQLFPAISNYFDNAG
jgi:hypothetical protein